MTADMTNLNTPPLAVGQLTEDDVARKQADLGAWTMLAEPLEAQPEFQGEQDVGDPWWFKWIVWPVVFVVSIAASIRWPHRIQP